MKHVVVTLVLSLVAWAPQASLAQETPDIKLAARKLSGATVTVRVRYVAQNEATQKPAENKPALEQAPAAEAERVIVCSGVLVDDSIIATHIYIAPDSQVRVTLPSGAQATAVLIAIDEYSGVALLQIDKQLEGAPPWSTDEMQAGQWVVSSAAWGAEDPVVSLGVVSAAKRSIRGATFPPLIECDMRSADTSSGAGVVSQRGELIGLVAAVEVNEQRGGWTYVVPVSHVGRLLRAWKARQPEKSILVLKRRRPVVGMVLTVDNGAVVAGRVAEGGPADKAGISKGDIVLAVEGVQIRSVYDVQRPVLHRQPGDQLELLVQTAGNQVKTIKIVLGGGVVLPPTLALQDFSRWVRPKYEIEQLADGRIVSRNARGEVRELAVVPPASEAETPQPGQQATLAEKLQLLEKALDRYQRVIALQQKEIDRRGQQQKQVENQLESLREEVDGLREQLEQGK